MSYGANSQTVNSMSQSSQREIHGLLYLSISENPELPHQTVREDADRDITDCPRFLYCSVYRAPSLLVTKVVNI